MSKSLSKPNDIDDILASFTDHALDGNDLPVDLVADPEAKKLAETVLRLQEAYKEINVSDREAKRIRAKVLAAWHLSQQTHAQKSGRLKEIIRALFPHPGWTSRQTRQRWGLAMAIAAMAIFIMLVAPLLSTLVYATPASAGRYTPSNLGILLAIIVAAAVVLWATRKK
jgi:hypothetical protein